MLGVLDKDICTVSWYVPKFKVSAVQSRGPRPQCFAVLKGKTKTGIARWTLSVFLPCPWIESDLDADR